MPRRRQTGRPLGPNLRQLFERIPWLQLVVCTRLECNQRACTGSQVQQQEFVTRSRCRTRYLRTNSSRPQLDQQLYRSTDCAKMCDPKCTQRLRLAFAGTRLSRCRTTEDRRPSTHRYLCRLSTMCRRSPILGMRHSCFLRHQRSLCCPRTAGVPPGCSGEQLHIDPRQECLRSACHSVLARPSLHRQGSDLSQQPCTHVSRLVVCKLPQPRFQLQ